MQELLEKRAKNRENQRRWREKNLERSRELHRISNWKARGTTGSLYYSKTSIQALGTRTEDTTPVEVAVCTSCSRKYLTKLYCLWCTDYIYGRRTDRTA